MVHSLIPILERGRSSRSLLVRCRYDTRRSWYDRAEVPGFTSWGDWTGVARAWYAWAVLYWYAANACCWAAPGVYCNACFNSSEMGWIRSASFEVCQCCWPCARINAGNFCFAHATQAIGLRARRENSCFFFCDTRRPKKKLKRHGKRLM